MTPKEMHLAATLLQLAGEHYSNHGCNDWDFPADWTMDEQRAFVREYHEYNGDPQEYDPHFLHLSDSAVMGFLAHKLRRSENPEGNEMSENVIPQDWQDAIRDSEKLLLLRDDWDDDGSPPPSKVAYDRAIVFLLVQVMEGYHRYHAWLPVPSISPGPDESIDAAWKRDCLANIPVDGPISYGGIRSDTDRVKGKLTRGYDDQLVRWLLRLPATDE